MGFLFPKLLGENSKKIGLEHWLKVLILLLITGLLTWYGKYYEPSPVITRVNELAVWILPHKNGLGAMAVLPNDNNDSNSIRTGLRIWLSPPDSLLVFEKTKPRYRGRDIIVIGDTLNDALKENVLSTLDSSGNFYWLGPFGKEQTGEDVFAELKLINDKPQDYLLDIIYEGYKLRFFGSQTALDSGGQEPLSVAILMFKPANENEPPLMNSKQIQTLIWRGKKENENDPTRIALNYTEAFALISFDNKGGLFAKRLHVKGWNPED
jgi:hypothetical protein